MVMPLLCKIEETEIQFSNKLKSRIFFFLPLLRNIATKTRWLNNPIGPWALLKVDFENYITEIKDFLFFFEHLNIKYKYNWFIKKLTIDMHIKMCNFMPRLAERNLLFKENKEIFPSHVFYLLVRPRVLMLCFWRRPKYNISFIFFVSLFFYIFYN